MLAGKKPAASKQSGLNIYEGKKWGESREIAFLWAVNPFYMMIECKCCINSVSVSVCVPLLPLSYAFLFQMGIAFVYGLSFVDTNVRFFYAI